MTVRKIYHCIGSKYGLVHATLLGVELMGKATRADRLDGGVIINIASLVGLDPWHLLPIYTASKHAIVGFSRAFSVRLLNWRFGRCHFHSDVIPYSSTNIISIKVASKSSYCVQEQPRPHS